MTTIKGIGKYGLILALLLVGGCEVTERPDGTRSTSIFYERSNPCPSCPDTVYVMPPGRWVKPKIEKYQVGDYEYEMKDSIWVLFRWPKNSIPDSIFILSKTLNEVEGKE